MSKVKIVMNATALCGALCLFDPGVAKAQTADATSSKTVTTASEVKRAPKTVLKGCRRIPGGIKKLVCRVTVGVVVFVVESEAYDWVACNLWNECVEFVSGDEPHIAD